MFNAQVIIDPVLEMPSLYIISNSHAANGGAILFLLP